MQCNLIKKYPLHYRASSADLLLVPRNIRLPRSNEQPAPARLAIDFRTHGEQRWIYEWKVLSFRHHHHRIIRLLLRRVVCRKSFIYSVRAGNYSSREPERRRDEEIIYLEIKFQLSKDQRNSGAANNQFRKSLALLLGSVLSLLPGHHLWCIVTVLFTLRSQMAFNYRATQRQRQPLQPDQKSEERQQKADIVSLHRIFNKLLHLPSYRLFVHYLDGARCDPNEWMAS